MKCKENIPGSNPACQQAGMLVGNRQTDIGFEFVMNHSIEIIAG
jgi:hypothetical protein